MTKYAKCGVCGYIVAIYDDADASDYVCPVDGTTLVVATRTEYMVIEKAAATFVIAASNSLHKQRADYVCDNVDDQVEIQAAIDALSTVGGVVYLLEGTYTTSASIGIIGKNNVTLMGSGMNSTKITCGANAHTLNIDGSDDVIIRDIRIDQTSTGNSVNAIRLDDAQRCKIQNVYIGDSDLNGIQFVDVASNYCEITGCYITLCDMDGVYVGASSSNTFISGNVIESNISGDGIYIYNADNAIVIENIVKSNAGGIGIEQSNNSIIVGNHSELNGAYGIICGDVTKSIINCNICVKNGEQGILIYSNSSHNIISNNTCISNSWGSSNANDGIYLLEVDYNNVVNNNCYDDHSGCAVAGCQRHGIYVRKSRYSTINGNICGDNLTDGIKIHGTVGNLADYNTLNGNVCEGNGGKGIYIFGDKGSGNDYANKNIVLGNQLFSNTGVNLDDDGTNTEIGHNITA